MDNLEIWNKVCRVPTDHLKPFQRGGGFKGTAIKPMWSIHRMTEVFGPCGQGWGIKSPSFQIVSAGDEILVYCTVHVWHGSEERAVVGVGGDKVLAKFSSGLKSDDEAFKKAFTDAVTNALKHIGVGGDVHMGLFDGAKYVNGNGEQHEEPKPEPQSDGKAFALLKDQLSKIVDSVSLDAWRVMANEMAGKAGTLSNSEKAELRRLLQAREAYVKDMEAKAA